MPLRQGLDSEGRGRTHAESDDHAVLDQLDGGRRRGALEGVAARVWRNPWRVAAEQKPSSSRHQLPFLSLR
ncbi:hypothetical protein [Vineibacter terrae]|uniref:hypothetical protein n=1 Tax=Vineibacter terrae TaxID=2586908 RepID=UPI002E30BD39|nr:hypothetical protein [Vineibacter terrae]HEX2887577.1 hypothetical protein [Vineibacter terrae]